MPIVFCGAFFLLNLTLAVINSKFTEAHKSSVESAQEKGPNLEEEPANSDDELEALADKDEMSISQFITARIYAKKMIEFLRMRQEIKRIETQRMETIRKKQKK